MTTLFLDCSEGSQKDTFAQCIGALLPREQLAEIEKASGALSVTSSMHGEHGHHSMDEVREKILAKPLSTEAAEAALGVYGVLAEAEAEAHGVPVEEVHFHEVGSDEAIAWVCAASASMVALAPDKVIAGPVCTGFGFVECDHGRLAIPTPATAIILRDVPTFKGDMEGELTTPTGAALVRYFADEFVDEEPPGCEIAAQVGSW